MTTDLIHDRGRGPEIVGTRITVYNLLQSFLDPTVTEDEICRIYDLTARQVAAARAYVLANPDIILAEHLKIEQRLAAGNPPEVRAQAGRAMQTLQEFKRWLAEREEKERQYEQEHPRSGEFPTFREWLAEQTAVPTPKPGTKEAVLQFFGAFKDENDLEGKLSAARKLRETEG
jgi:uncharacterized protein (DUF433 family)